MNQRKICKCEYCDRETFNKNDDCCIFHSKDIEGKKNQFNEAFDREFKLQDQKEDDFNFFYFIFPNDFDYFKENIIKKNIHFLCAIFKGVAGFMGTTFKGVAYFSDATFEGEAYFEEVESINYNKLNLRDTFFYNLRGLLDQVEKEIKNNKLDNIYYINKFKKKDSNKILSKLKNWFINRFTITKFL